MSIIDDAPSSVTNIVSHETPYRHEMRRHADVSLHHRQQ